MAYIIISIGIGGVALLFYMYQLAFVDQVVYHELHYPHFPESFGEMTIFFISDIHKRIVTNEIIHQVKEKVDFVIIGGDLLEKGVSLERVERNIKRLKKLGPVFFVSGNNDYEIDPNILEPFLRSLDVTILNNTAISCYSEKGDRFVLLGIDDLTTERDRLDLALESAGEDGFRVLVSHNPKVIQQIFPEHHISLVLSGHTHGGQIRLFGIGLYEKGRVTERNGTKILTSNGYGTTGIPLRLGVKPETHLIILKNNNE